jgi:hypothetical protein
MRVLRHQHFGAHYFSKANEENHITRSEPEPAGRSETDKK